MISSIRPLCKKSVNFVETFCAVSRRLQVFGSLMDEEGFWVYGAPDRNFGAPATASGNMRLTESYSDTNVIHFCPVTGTGMDSGGAAAVVAIAGRMMYNSLFDGAATCHCISYGCLASAPLSNLDVAGGRICWQ